MKLEQLISELSEAYNNHGNIDVFVTGCYGAYTDSLEIVARQTRQEDYDVSLLIVTDLMTG